MTQTHNFVAERSVIVKWCGNGFEGSVWWNDLKYLIWNHDFRPVWGSFDLDLKSLSKAVIFFNFDFKSFNG